LPVHTRISKLSRAPAPATKAAALVGVAAGVLLICALWADDCVAGDLRQSSDLRQAPSGMPIGVAPADPAIAAALRRLDAAKVRADIEKLVSFNNRNTLSSMDKDLQAGTGVSAAADWIAAEFARISAACGGCIEVKRDEFVEPPQTGPAPRILRPTRIVNVYAVLRGSDPAQAARRVLVTGHYDSRNSDTLNTHDPAPGANDDASGVAVSLECARILSALHLPATVVFVAVAGEEQGLNGSGHLAKLAVAEGWELEAVLNNDIVGGDSTPGETRQDKTAVRVFSEGVAAPATLQQVQMIRTLGTESDSPSRELARAIEEIGKGYFAQSAPVAAGTRKHFHAVLIFRQDRFLRGGDHSSFNDEGFSAVRFTEWRENFDHQHQNERIENGVQFGDLPRFVDVDYTANVARLNAAVLATLASAPGEPRDVGVLTAALDNNTTLSWAPPPGMPATATYEVVWRPTENPTWMRVMAVGPATTVTLPVSKDNVIFGVRSVDAAGHRSVAVTPLPKRDAPAAAPTPAGPH
jgi:Peptidase family M28